MNLYFIELKNTEIEQQLLLEEALLRTDERNFCLINRGAPPAIVMGLSGVAEELLDHTHLAKTPIPVFRRFSGGGTVVLDEETLFISFIISKHDLPSVVFPEQILRWSTQLYQTAWNIPGFTLKEQDYAIDDRKCGGNAQYLRKERWLHHTSFLWDYQNERMKCLLLPKKRPAYRLNRSHNDFLCKLKAFAPSVDFLIHSLKEVLKKQFDTTPLPQQEMNEILTRTYRIATRRES